MKNFNEGEGYFGRHIGIYLKGDSILPFPNISVLLELVLENIGLISVSNQYFTDIIFLQADTDTDKYFNPIPIPIIVSVSVSAWPIYIGIGYRIGMYLIK